MVAGPKTLWHGVGFSDAVYIKLTPLASISAFNPESRSPLIRGWPSFRYRRLVSGSLSLFRLSFYFNFRVTWQLRGAIFDEQGSLAICFVFNQKLCRLFVVQLLSLNQYSFTVTIPQCQQTQKRSARKRLARLSIR